MRKMVHVSDFEIFSNQCSTLKETSKDHHGEEELYMTDSLMEVVDFDKVKEVYAENLHLQERPKSNDAIYFGKNGELTFIEFKNGTVEPYEIRRKCFDSILILTDIIGKGISYTRENVNYILVYNETTAKDFIKKKFLEKGGKEFTKYGAGYFENYCFKSVHTWTADEFESKFVRVNS